MIARKDNINSYLLWHAALDAYVSWQDGSGNGTLLWVTDPYKGKPFTDDAVDEVYYKLRRISRNKNKHLHSSRIVAEALSMSCSVTELWVVPLFRDERTGDIVCNFCLMEKLL